MVDPQNPDAPADAEATGPAGVDPMELVQAVLRESYAESAEDLRRYAEKVRYWNATKRALRAYLDALRTLRADVLSAAVDRGLDTCAVATEDVAMIGELIDERSYECERGEVERSLCIPSRVPEEGVDRLQRLDLAITRWEDRLASVGDDGQLANIDLQNMLQKQQQTLQMMSNLSKTTHDNAMAVIRKLLS